MKYEQYRRKKWREQIKFRMRECDMADKAFEALRLAFVHLCFECKSSRFCPYRKYGRIVLLTCPYFEPKEIEKEAER